MARSKYGSPNQLALYQRAKEAIEYLIGENGHTDLNKADFAVLMAARLGPEKGRVWLMGDGTGNRRLVEEVCNLTRDQDEDELAKEFFAGYVVSYAPNIGGMTLLDADGDLIFDHLLHMLSGDMTRQEATKTINRRRLPSWNKGGHQALNSGEPDIGRIMFQIEHSIEATGFAPASLVADFLRLVNDRRGQEQPR